MKRLERWFDNQFKIVFAAIEQLAELIKKSKDKQPIRFGRSKKMSEHATPDRYFAGKILGSIPFRVGNKPGKISGNPIFMKV